MSLEPLRPEWHRLELTGERTPSLVTDEWLHAIGQLRRGIAEREFHVYLQPIVGADRRVRGFEALSRWQHPERGLLAPSAYISVAETTGLIVDLGMWMIDRCCWLLGEWAQDPRRLEYSISVNVSARQLGVDGFVEAIEQALERYGVPEGKLKLEVTESLVHVNVEQSFAMLERVSALGVAVALDDFGTGYSSLSYLRRLPVQAVKIDRSFVIPVADDPTDAALVGLIVDFAKVLGLEVVAEGVETMEQYATLRELGVDLFQGYLFGAPVPWNEVAIGV